MRQRDDQQAAIDGGGHDFVLGQVGEVALGVSAVMIGGAITVDL